MTSSRMQMHPVLYFIPSFLTQAVPEWQLDEFNTSEISLNCQEANEKIIWRKQ